MYKMAEKMRRGISFFMIVLVFLTMGMAGVEDFRSREEYYKHKFN